MGDLSRANRDNLPHDTGTQVGVRCYCPGTDGGLTLNKLLSWLLLAAVAELLARFTCALCPTLKHAA